MVKSLDSVIATLDSTRRRDALVAQLKKLREAARQVGPPVSASQAAEAPRASGLFGAVASGFTRFEARVLAGDTPIDYWIGRFNAAGNEFYTIASGQGHERPLTILLDFAMMLAVWGGCAAVLIFIQHKLCAHYRWKLGLPANPATPQVMIFVFRRIGPWIVSFLAALQLARSTGDPSMGRMIAMVLAYAIVCGAAFSAICLIMFSLFGSSGHRRIAVQILTVRARRRLFAIGVCGALGDAALNYNVGYTLGPNLSGLVSTAANIGAAVLSAHFVLQFRRPVAHLIENRPYTRRCAHPVTTEAFDVIGAFWHVPMLLLALASVVATLWGVSSTENVLQRAVASAALLVVAFFLSAIVLRVTRPRARAQRRRAGRQSAYIGRMVRFVGTLVTLAIWTGFFELAARTWDYSVIALAEDTASGRGITQSMLSICVIVFVGWLLWIMLDTAVQEALSPTGPRGKARMPSTRARTMLPLVRNAAAVAIVTVATIAVLANLGLNVTPLLAGAGVIGLAVGFGAQTLVQDLITGLFIIIEDTISVGDSIDIDGGHAGIVENLTIRTVRVRDGQGAIHAIPFSQIKIVKNLSRDFAYAVIDVRVPFSADVESVTRMIREVGADLIEDFRYRREILGPIEVWGLDRFDPNWMVIKGQIKTRPLQQWSVARAFNLRLKLKMDEAGMAVPVPQMEVRLTSPADARADVERAALVIGDAVFATADGTPPRGVDSVGLHGEHEPLV
jgi:small conductance mechanosensitive channel